MKVFFYLVSQIKKYFRSLRLMQSSREQAGFEAHYIHKETTADNRQ